jgi:ADP-heptose:LPS heptosyltransferase
MNSDDYTTVNAEGTGEPESLIKRLSQKLDQLPQKPPQEPKKTTLKAIVYGLYPQLKAKKLEGYKYKQLADILMREGLTISPESLRKYMSEVEKLDRPHTSGESKHEAPEFPSSGSYPHRKVDNRVQKLSPERRARLTGQRFQPEDLESEFENI